MFALAMIVSYRCASAGEISASGTAVVLQGAGTVINQSTGTITGRAGIYLPSGTVMNAGYIFGAEGVQRSLDSPR